MSRMGSADDIVSLKRELLALEKRVGRIDERQRPTVLRLAGKLKGLIGDIEATTQREKSLWNPAIMTRMRIVKKGFELSKELGHFEEEVAAEFEKGNVPKEEGKRFIQAVKFIKLNKMPAAKNEFAYFEELMETEGRYEKAKEELEEKDASLKRERIKIEKVMAEVSELERTPVDAGKARRYAELMESLDKLKAIREDYIDSLLSMPVVELLKEIGKHSPENYFSEFPGKEEMAGLAKFFIDYPEIGRWDAKQLCESFGFSEKKLSHVCPETSRFKKAVLGSRSFFETLSALKQTPFLAVDDKDESILAFYEKNIGSAKAVVERIRELRKDKLSDKEEYEKSLRIDKRKAELSRYPKADMEAELKEIDQLLGVLHSEEPAESGGLLSSIWQSLKRL